MKSIFPFSDIEKGSRVILYGAAGRGYDFYRQIVSSGYCDLILWVDRQYEWYRYMNLPVETPKKVRDVSFDIVVVSAEKENVYRSIRKDLLDLGIHDGQIFWKEDCRLRGKRALTFEKGRIKQEAKEAYQISPRELLHSHSLDLIIRYLYVEDILCGENGTENEERYLRFMEAANGLNEPTEDLISALFSEYSMKRGAEAYKLSFKELIDSMKKNGFRRECFIPLDRHGHMINGGHRIAAALALGIDVWVRTYPFDGVGLDFGEGWLHAHGFSRGEIELLCSKYRELIK